MNWTEFVSLISTPYYDSEKIKELEKKKGKKFKISFFTKVYALMKFLSSFATVLLFWPAMFKWATDGNFNWMLAVIACLVSAAVADILLERSNKRDGKRINEFMRT